jgi:hypothetical protein
MTNVCRQLVSDDGLNTYIFVPNSSKSMTKKTTF